MKIKNLALFLVSVLVSVIGCAQEQNLSSQTGEYTEMETRDGMTCRIYAAGPKSAKSGIIFVHDYFGITKATEESVRRLGRMGYRTIAVDLYNGQTANTDESATELMEAVDSIETANILRAGIDYLKKPGRKLGAIGFSAGGIHAMKATLMEPELFSATVIVYGGNYDQIESASLHKLQSPVLSIMGTLDDWPVNAALNFFAKNKDILFEMYFYPGAKHGYAQPLFQGGKNYDEQATRVTWMLMSDFLNRNLKL